MRTMMILAAALIALPLTTHAGDPWAEFPLVKAEAPTAATTVRDILLECSRHFRHRADHADGDLVVMAACMARPRTSATASAAAMQARAQALLMRATEGLIDPPALRAALRAETEAAMAGVR